jgi:AbiV family abortive infection protein
MANTKLPSNKEKLSEGAIYCFEMCRRHLTASMVLAEKKEYSIANSLLILCAEEALKSFILFSYARGMKFEGLDLKHFFSDHKPRHDFIKKVFLTIQGLNTLGRVQDKHLDYIKKGKELKIGFIGNVDVKKIGFDISNCFSPNEIDKFFNEFYKTYDKNESKKMLDWWKNADQQKKEGFYVDYKSGFWETPSLKKNDYEITEKYVYEILQSIHNLRLAYNSERILKAEFPEEYDNLMVTIKQFQQENNK